MKQSDFIVNRDTEMRLKLHPGMYSTLCRMNVVENMIMPLMYVVR